MTYRLFIDIMTIIQGISLRIDAEAKCYEVLFEDFQGLNKGMCNVLDELIDMLDRYNEDNLVSWYVYDNDFGNAQLEYDGKPIISYTDLYELIFKGET